MPRTRIPLPDGLDHLSILDETGTLDAALEPKIAPEVLLRLHHVMLLARRFDERLLSLQRQGRIGTFPPIAGQEAAHLGAAAVLRPDDWMVPAFREMAADIWRGRPLDRIIEARTRQQKGALGRHFICTFRRRSSARRRRT